VNNARAKWITGMLSIWLWGCLLATGAARGDAPVSVDFLPQWSPQSQFAGYYVADAKGFYERRGLTVNVLRGGPDRPAGVQLSNRRVTFTTLFLTEGIALRDQGVPLVNIGQIVQRSALMLVALKKSGIRSPDDLDGRRVSVWDDFRLQPLAFFRQNHLSVSLVPQGYTPNLFLMGGVDAASAMWYNEYHVILNSGIDADELSTFLLADYGFNFPEDGIYCLEETLHRDPEAVRAFVQGSIEGWRYTFDHPEEAMAIVMACVDAANLPTNRVHQRWMLARMGDIICPGGNCAEMGRLNEANYLFVARQLRDNGIIQAIPDYQEFYDPRHATP